MKLTDPASPRRLVTVGIDEDSLVFEVSGATTFGEPIVLLEHEENLLAGTSHDQQGFVVCPFLTERQNRQLRLGLIERLHEVIEHFVPKWNRQLSLSEYHTLIDDHCHRQVVARTQEGISTDELPIDVGEIEERISQICGRAVTTIRPDSQTSKFNLRLVRPGTTDNNPPHRDVWLPHLKNAVNLYFPIVGSNPGSSLPLLPGSHRWPEADIERTREGAAINGIRYRVPAVVGCRERFQMTRPAVEPNELLVFSPYLIHGGGANFSSQTRISLEMRFWRRQ